MKKMIVIITGLMLMFAGASALSGNDVSVKPDETTKISNDSITDQFVVYYLHMNRRCMTCEKLEAYSEEAIMTGFTEQLKDSSIVWKVVNFEEEGNEHFAKDYNLYSQSVVISKLLDGKETEWKNLDKIWEIVGNKDEFIAYVQGEVTKFITPVVEK
jgi:hypothetical protein